MSKHNKSEYVNKRPDFGIWLEMVAMKHNPDNVSNSFKFSITSKAKGIINKMASEDRGGESGEANWMMYRKSLFDYNPQKETLYDKLLSTLTYPAFFNSPDDVWNDEQVKMLIELYEAWLDYWMIFMTCPFGSGDKNNNCTGWGCLGWDTEKECCYRMERGK